MTNQNANLHDLCRMSSGSNLTVSSSESSSGLNSPQELKARNFIQHSPTSFLSSLGYASVPQKLIADESARAHQEQQRSKWEWSLNLDGDLSTDDSKIILQNVQTSKGTEQASHNEVERLNAELFALARQADVSELELQTLRKQMVKETKRSQRLSIENVRLKEERDSLKEESEKFKAFKSNFQGGDLQAVTVELRKEVSHEKEVNAHLRLQLQKTQDSNAELVLAVKELDDMLKQKDRESPKIAAVEDEDQKALIELIKGQAGANDPTQLDHNITDLCSEIANCKREKDELEMQMEQLALDYEILRQENHKMLSEWEQFRLQEQLNVQYQCASCLTNGSEWENHIQILENDLKSKSESLSDALATINKLETRIYGSERELEKQAIEFEAAFEDITCAKVEQEQRAIRAEETLRKTRQNYGNVAEKTRRKYANVAERIQEEFKNLSMQMLSTFEANEAVTAKALTEARELRAHKSQLEETLQKANEELLSVREYYEAKMEELSREIKVKTDQIEHMVLEISENSRKLEHQMDHETEDCKKKLSREIATLKSEITRLSTDNHFLSDQEENQTSELKQMKKSLGETKIVVENGNAERDELVGALASMKKEMEDSLMELDSLRQMKDQKEIVIESLKSELENLKAQSHDMKRSIVDDNSGKERLRKQAIKPKGDLKKQEDAFTVTEKKRNRRAVVSDGKKGTPRSNKPAQVSSSNKELTSLQEKIKLLEDQIQSKQAAFDSMKDSFLARESDLQNIIEELERRLQEKRPEDIGEITPTSVTPEEKETLAENLCSVSRKPGENGDTTHGDRYDIVLDSEAFISGSNAREGNFDKLLTESASLRERNEAMELELKDLQERYSQISLKFAEVEGERQQLVMALRNLKNAKTGN
ncbi:A-kinase anchor protein 9-like [Rhodamnia argentea]|uniref:A-kinase anchor protein 9-like n=1 Tax=Rhodamnia argentea TaxID=178133 RepID=A0A8B8PUN0_9MYRT|nr:A-kinase anchor protein 9-like [Rhodamnia argentea]